LCKYATEALENKQYFSVAFLDISQAFDKVWRTGLLYKLGLFLPLNYFMLLKSSLHSEHFLLRAESEQTELSSANAGVHRSSDLGPLLYLPTSTKFTTATLSDDTAVLATDSDPGFASQKLQSNRDATQKWL
jgi:hypothetical protein